MIMTIVHREVKDTVSDWRIMIPMFLLAFLLPFTLAVGARQFIKLADEEGLAFWLLPFGVLLVGFIPSSFSLITALESFVGERERNSLEALLATPISDNDLYIGKLIASLVAPLTSSYVAIAVFVVMVGTSDPTLTFPLLRELSPTTILVRLGLIAIIVGLMGVTMVAGAVIISSHISSVRAANLMASFILVPMAVVVQGVAFLMIHERWDVLLISSAGLCTLALLLTRGGMLSFNREGILAREHQHLDDLHIWQRLFRTRADAHAARPVNRFVERFLGHPVVVVIRREVRESLTDWRVLLPAFVLTVIIPLALIAGVDFAKRVLLEEDPDLPKRIAPFVILLVGFIPATFSLIVALDTFVGERERNSLEAMLATPISDTQLYFGKLIASIIPPLLTSLSAMLIFANALRFFYPDIYFFRITPARLNLLLLTNSMMTVLMVAAAVLISSHASSIRVANLLASFILIPAAVFLQTEGLVIVVGRWEVVQFFVYMLLIIIIALLRAGISAFNREEIISREHETISLKTTVETLVKCFREYQPAGTPLNRYQGLPFSAVRFYRHELPMLMWEIRFPILMSIGAALAGIWLGHYLVGNYLFIGAFQETIERYIARVGSAPAPSPFLTALIFANNARVSLISNVLSSFGFGVFALLVPLVAFAQVSFVATTLYTQHGSWFSLDPAGPMPFLLGYVLPHGVIELPTFVLCAAFGIRIGASILGAPPGISVGQNLLWALGNFLKVWILLLLPLIFIGSVVEGMISPVIIQELYR